MREWIFARQRYWGEPVPVVHLENGKSIALPDEELPLVLPELKDYQGKNGKALSFAILPAFQRKGYMYEAVSGVIDHLFREEKADYINCGYLSYNAPSKALQEKLGFTYLLTERFQFDGQEM